MTKKKRPSLVMQSSPRNALKLFSEFCNRYQKFACVGITHNVLTGYQFGAPEFTIKAINLSSSERKHLLNTIVAVERSVYMGLRSRYLLRLPKQREQLLRGLAHGFTHNDLRISHESLQECIDHENFRIMDCSYYELRSGIWKSVSNRLVNYFCGVEDNKGRWRENLYVPSSVLGRIPSGLMLIVDDAAKKFQGDNIIEIKSSGRASSISKILSGVLGCKIPGPERARRTVVPALIWPKGDPKKPEKIISSQWAT